MAPIILELKKKSKDFKTQVCMSGQHRELVDQIIGNFNFQVDFDLNVMTKGQNLGQLTARLIEGLYKIIESFKPDLILVQGDTTTAFVGALAGFYQQIQVGHVEAGLRTSNKYAPFPEEMNRHLIGVLADHHFAPTNKSKFELLKEGVNDKKILVTGNTVIDALFLAIKRVRKNPPLLGELNALLSKGNRIVLITGHRRENFGEGFEKICQAIKSLAKRFIDVTFVYPVHLNPNVQQPVRRILGNLKNVSLTPPLDYFPFVRLMSRSSIILTDSGGIQEEAPSLGIPVVVMREVTERSEAVEAGTAILVGTDKKKIFETVSMLLTDEQAWKAMSQAANPYGDGKASRRIVDYLVKIQS